MNYREQIEKKLGLKILTKAEFVKELFDIDDHCRFRQELDSWEQRSKGHPFICTDNNGNYYSLDFLLENGAIEPEDFDIDKYLEKECGEYFGGYEK